MARIMISAGSKNAWPRWAFTWCFARARPNLLSGARRAAQGSGNPAQYDDLQAFIGEQDLLRRLVGQSILPTLELDVSDNSVDRAVERIADWMTQTGGLWAK